MFTRGKANSQVFDLNLNKLLKPMALMSPLIHVTKGTHFCAYTKHTQGTDNGYVSILSHERIEWYGIENTITDKRLIYCALMHQEQFKFFSNLLLIHSNSYSPSIQYLILFMLKVVLHSNIH